MVKVVVLVLLVSFLFSTRVLAVGSDVGKTDIVIDGNFDDWKDKPYVEGSKKDIKSSWLDFLGLGYFADDKYLYLHVIRQAAKKSDLWHFDVVMLNATKGEVQLQYPFGSTKAVYAPQFDIKLSYDDNRSHNGILVNVGFNGQQLESTFSSDNNAKEIEFRVPLSYVGLDGVNKEVKFALKSDADGVIDWVPDSTITITTGPTLWQVSSIFFFVSVSATAYGVYRKRKITRDNMKSMLLKN